MEGDEPYIPPEVEANENLEGIAENVAVFEQFVYEVHKALEKGDIFDSKYYIESHLREISNLHNSLADQYTEMIEEVDSNQVLLEKISYLEAQVASLKKTVESLTVKNGELNQEIKDNITDIKVYMSKTKMEIKGLEADLKASKEFGKAVDEQMHDILAQKLIDDSRHEAEMAEVNMKMSRYITEISQLKRTHEKKEMIWNDVTDQLKDELKAKCDCYEELSKNMAVLIKEKSDQKPQNGLVSFDNVQKLIDEVKLKMAELEGMVDWWAGMERESHVTNRQY